MPTESSRDQQAADAPTTHEDEPIPAASEDKVLDETARLAREGREALDADPKEKPASD